MITNAIAILCATAGFLIIILGFVLGLYGMVGARKEYRGYVTDMMASLMSQKSGQAAAPSVQPASVPILTVDSEREPADERAGPRGAEGEVATESAGQRDASQAATQGSALSANEVSEVVKALAEFAKSLMGLPQAIQAFLISIILFLSAAVLTFVR